MNLLNLPIGKNCPDIVDCIIEIPKGTRSKYEYDPEFEVFRLNKILSTSMLYPVNYGFIPQTLAQDGDALDVMVHSMEPIITGAIVKCHVLCVLDVVDRKEFDYKVLAVPVQKRSNPTAVDDVFKNVIRNFFENYKKLEDGASVVVNGWLPKKSALNIIMNAHNRFKEHAQLKH